MAIKINWLTEQQAATMLGYKPKVLRMYCRNEKLKKLPIQTKKLNAKTVIYSGVDLENYINGL